MQFVDLLIIVSDLVIHVLVKLQFILFLKTYKWYYQKNILFLLKTFKCLAVLILKSITMVWYKRLTISEDSQLL